VAVTTPTSEDRGNWNKPHPHTRAMQHMWFGRHVPEGVTAITVMRSYIDDQLLVRWRTKHDIADEIHEMPFEQTDEGVMAALVAMKLTC
jgi:hypothetical protein